MLEKYSMNQKNKNQQRNLLTPENALLERTCQQSIHKYMKNRQFSRPSAEGGRPSAEVEKSFRPSAERSASAEGEKSTFGRNLASGQKPSFYGMTI